MCIHGVGDVLLGGRPGGGADGHAVEGLPVVFQPFAHADHQRLAVVEVGRAEVQRVLRVAGQRPGGVAHQDVDLAGDQGGEPVLGADNVQLQRVGSGLAEDGGGIRLAEVDVEADDLTGVGVEVPEAEQFLVDAADQLAAIAHKL